MANYSTALGFPRFKNNAVTTLAEGIVAGTEAFNVADGTVFPSITSPQYFFATIINAAGQREIVKVTNVAGNTITVVRAQEGTTARSYSTSDIMSHRLTAGVIDDIVDDLVEHEGDVATNAGNISTNAASIVTNASGIATNVSNIATNTAAIAAMGLNQYIHITDRKTAGTNGGAKTTGWQIRTLNTEDVDEGNNATLDTNVITLLAGTYDVSISAPMYANSYAAAHKIRLYDVTNSATLLVGTSEYCALNTQTRSVIKGRIVLAAETQVRVDHYCVYPQTVYGLGYPVIASGEVEIYTIVELWRQV